MMSVERPIVIIIVCLLVQIDNCHSSDDILDLIAEPDYRAVLLKWNYLSKAASPASFRIRYCEITSWNSKSRCKEQIVNTKRPFNDVKEHLDTDDAVIDLHETVPGAYQASLTNLRMLTNYSISVWPTSSDSAQQLNDVNPNSRQDSQIFVETKSFSARTSRCLANSSEIEVQTGPYFRGKISVEGASNPECAMYGNRTNEQNLYKFVINNEACGARLMNNSRIETMVIVHENKEILTHNSRRYLVICTFHPEIHSLTASVSVPSHLLKKVFERLRDRNFQLTAAKKQTRNKMKRFSQSSSTVGLKQSEQQNQQQHESPQKQPFRDSRALSSGNELPDHSSVKLAFTLNQTSSSSSSSSSSISSSSSPSQSSISHSSLPLALSPITSSLSGRDGTLSLFDIVAEHKFILSSMTVLLLCLTVSVYLLVSHNRCTRSHYSHDSVHRRRYRCDDLLHNTSRQQHTHHQQHHRQHRLSPNVPFDKRRHFDSLDAARKDSILNL